MAVLECFVMGAEMAAGVADSECVDRARSPFGASRWRASVQDLGCLGRILGRRFFNDEIVPALTSGDYCGSLMPSCNGAPPGLGGGGCFRCRSWKGKGSRDLVVIFVFLEALSALLGGTAVLCILMWRTCTGLYTFP
jgi:hypothetical protein